MIDTDKRELAELVRTTLKVYRAEADKDVLRLWFGVLARFDMALVRAGFVAFVSNAKSKFQPVPADIVAMIEKLAPDGRPDANEAWAMIPKNEDSSVVMSQEMAEALGIAQPLLNDGDAIGARMAFRDAYNRIVERNKLAGVAPSWFPSLGRNAEMRVAALEQAARLGRIGYDHAAALFPPVQSAALLAKKTLAIEDKSGLSKEQQLARCTELKAMLAQSRFAC
jgi:hypothetical protein